MGKVVKVPELVAELRTAAAADNVTKRQAMYLNAAAKRMALLYEEVLKLREGAGTKSAHDSLSDLFK